jgi:hypothetical protein
MWNVYKIAICYSVHRDGQITIKVRNSQLQNVSVFTAVRVQTYRQFIPLNYCDYGRQHTLRSELLTYQQPPSFCTRPASTWHAAPTWTVCPSIPALCESQSHPRAPAGHPLDENSVRNSRYPSDTQCSYCCHCKLNSLKTRWLASGVVHRVVCYW